jgi:hypothetical protein
MSALSTTARSKSVPIKSASIMSALSTTARSKSVPIKSAPIKSAPIKSALSTTARSKSGSTKSVPNKSDGRRRGMRRRRPSLCRAPRCGQKRRPRHRLFPPP